MLTRHILRRLPVLALPQLNIHRTLENNASFRVSREEELARRQLWLKFKHKNITKDSVMKLTDGIQRVQIIPRDQGCFVYLDFSSEEEAEAKLLELQQEGIWVDYCGTKLATPRRRFPGQTGNTYVDKNSDKKLRLRFSSVISEEEILQLSDEIKKVKVRYHDNTTKAIVEFETPEQTEKHYDFFNIISIREWPAKVYKCSLKAAVVKEATQLLMKDLKEAETEEDLRELFPEATEIFIFYSLFNQRWGRVKFDSPAACQSALERQAGLRDVQVYLEVDKGEDLEKKSFNPRELRIRLMPWHTRTVLKKMFKKADHFRFYNRLNTTNGVIQRFAFVSFDDEEDCRQAAFEHKEYDIQYSFDCEFDHKTLVLNGISEWDTAESVHQLFPEADKVYVHKSLSEDGSRTFRNAFIMFDSEEKSKRALDNNVRRRLYYRIKP